jgi:hypothetical protein
MNTLCTKKVIFFPVYTIKAYRRYRDIAPLILNHLPRWMWVVNFKPRPLYPQVRNPVPIEQEDGWAPEAFRSREKSLSLTRIRIYDCPASCLVTISTALVLIVFCRIHPHMCLHYR